MENISRVFQKQQQKKAHEESEFHNSIQDLSFYYHLTVAQNCLEQVLITSNNEHTNMTGPQ